MLLIDFWYLAMPSGSPAHEVPCGQSGLCSWGGQVWQRRAKAKEAARGSGGKWGLSASEGILLTSSASRFSSDDDEEEVDEEEEDPVTKTKTIVKEEG